MKLGAPRGINTNFIQSCVEQKWHSAHFSNSGVKWLDRGAVLILFHGLYLRTFAPNYLTLPSPNKHCIFHLILCSWHFSHQQNVFSLLSSIQTMSILQDPDQSHSDKLFLNTAVWNNVSIFWTSTMFAGTVLSVVLRLPASKMHYNLYIYKDQKELWQFSHCFHKSTLPFLEE